MQMVPPFAETGNEGRIIEEGVKILHCWENDILGESERGNWRVIEL